MRDGAGVKYRIEFLRTRAGPFPVPGTALHDWRHPVPLLGSALTRDPFKSNGRSEGGTHDGMPEDGEGPGRFIEDEETAYHDMELLTTYQSGPEKTRKLPIQQMSRTLYQTTLASGLGGCQRQFMKAASLFAT
jgi:hypothetical protein